MSKSQILDEGVYIMDNSPEFDDTTFIKIDYIEDATHEESHETWWVDEANLCKKDVDFKIPESQLSHKIRKSVNSRRNTRVKEALMRISSRNSLSCSAVLNSESAKQQQLLEFIKVLTWEVQAKSSIGSSKIQNAKNLKLNYKMKEKKNLRSSDSWDSPTCSGSENGREYV